MSTVSRIKIKNGVLVDPQRESPVDQYQLRARRRNVAIVVVILIAVVAFLIWRSSV
jgi:hypothetical protein